MKRYKTLLILGGIFLLGAVAGAVLYFAFTIKTITVEGSTRYSQEEITDYIFTKEQDYHSIIFLLKSRFGEQVSIPFVEEYEVEMDGLDTVYITVYEKSLVGYVTYMGSCFYIDKDGYVVESSDEPLEDVPYVTGLSFDYIILHEKLPVEDDQTFDVLLNVAQQLKKYDLEVDRIYVSSNLSISLYIGNVKVNLGNDNMITEKIAELKDISPNLVGYSGTLDMTEYSEDNSGYILKLDNYLGNSDAEEEETDGEDGGEDGAGEDGESGEEETTSRNEENELIDDEVGINYMDGDDIGDSEDEGDGEDEE